MRYFRYLKTCFSMSLFRSVEYRAGVFLQYMLDLVWYVVQFALLLTAYTYVPQLGGYSLQEAYIFLGFLYAFDAVSMTFFNGGIEHFTRAIRNGGLDFYLLKPMGTLYQIAVARVSLAGTANVLFTAAFWIYVLMRFEVDYPAWRWALAGALFLNGMLINLTIRLTVASFAFWTIEGGSLNWLFHELMRFGQKPEAIYPRGFRYILTTFVPVLLISAWPAMALTRPITLWEATYPFLIGLGSLGILKLIWGGGIRRYEGLSFQQ